MASPGYIKQNVFSPMVFAGNNFPEPLQWFEPTANYVSWAAVAVGANTNIVCPIVLPVPVACSRMDVYVSGNYSATAGGSSAAHTISASVGVYTKNGSSLSLAVSGSQSYAFTVTGSSSSNSYHGVKNLTIPLNAQLYEGNYWVGVISNTSSAGNAIADNFSAIAASYAGAQSKYSGQFGQASAGTSNQVLLGYGIQSVTTSAVPGSIALSDISGAVGNTGRLIFNFVNYTA